MFLGRGESPTCGESASNMENVMWPANVKIDPAASDAAAVKCEPAGESAGASSKGDPWSDTTNDAEERVPEEAGYGHGV